MTQYTYYGALRKEAGALDYLSAAGRGIGIANQGNSMPSVFHPIDSLKGAYRGVMGQAAQNETAGMREQGMKFNQDAYGRIQNVDVPGSIAGYGKHLLGGATDGISSLWNQVQQPGGISNMLGQAGAWAGQHPGMLLGGLGAAVGGGYLLKNLFGGGGGHQHHQSMPNQQQMYQQSMMAPQAFEKAGFDFMPSPMEAPHFMADALVNGVPIPGMRHEDSNHMPKQQEYNPHFETSDPQLQKTLQDPKMREYLVNLIKQTGTQSNSTIG